MELEITESLVLQDDEATARVLSELRAMGLRIALDDFGTGYSSLSYLARFPLDILKLDRSFVRDVTMNSSARGIAAAVISMAHVLGLSVVAEGVDQKEQARFLREQGCDELQGFLFSGPLDPDEFLRFRASHENSRRAKRER
jgi:EAL domain-containing protein (putative c-di-GMP-specific phosphodiesterase class I)